VARRIGLAAGIVRNLHEIWKANDISKSTKVLLYQTLVRAIILYNSETWTLKEEQKRKLRVLEMSVLRKICGITRRDRRRNVDVLKELDIENNIVQVYVCSCIWLYPCMVPAPREDQRRNGLTIFVKTALTWTFHYMRLPVSLRIGRPGGTLFSIWAANAQCNRHRRNGSN